MGTLGSAQQLCVAGTARNLPPVANGIITPWLVGQTSDGAGFFLTYAANGFVPAETILSKSTNINAAPSAAPYRASSGRLRASSTIRTRPLARDGTALCSRLRKATSGLTDNMCRFTWTSAGLAAIRTAAIRSGPGSMNGHCSTSPPRAEAVGGARRTLVWARQFRTEMAWLDCLPDLDAGKDAPKPDRSAQNRGRRKSCAAGRTPRRLGFAPTRRGDALARPAVIRKIIWPSCRAMPAIRSISDGTAIVCDM
jgi:hypothetical protein